MKHLKSYRIFESIKGESVFPDKSDVEEVFFDVTDEGITKFSFESVGYLYFPYVYFDATTPNGLRLEMYDDMVNNSDNWQNQKPEELMGDSWKDLFLDLSDSRNNYMLVKTAQWLELDTILKSMAISKLNKLCNKPFLELFVENIENAKIKAYPFIYLRLDSFESKYLDNVVECLERLYDMTGYRPVREMWTEDYVDETNGNIVNLIGCNLELLKLSDIEYKNLTSVFSNNSIDKEVVKKFL